MAALVYFVGRKHKDPERKERYIDGHNKNEYWTKSGVKAAMFYSKHILWNKPTLQATIVDMNKTFNKFKI